MQTTCNYCSLGCNFDVTTDGNEITKIIPSKNYPVNKGFSCIKGLNLDKQGVMNSPEAKPRITAILNMLAGMKLLNTRLQN